jgi:UDP-N-acetylmuramyl pentapeptide phosphotransferase/UDP-N-acetylglucosamine-1-phosphate transferase
MQDGWGIVTVVAIFATAALLSAVLIVVLRPLLARYAIARPNARSSHVTPTPQGGGIVVIAATITVSSFVLFFSTDTDTLPLTLVFAGVLLIAAVGVLADNHPVDERKAENDCLPRQDAQETDDGERGRDWDSSFSKALG